MSGFSAAGVVDEAKERSDNEHFPVPADGQDPLEVGDGRRNGDLVGHNALLKPDEAEHYDTLAWSR